MKLRNLIAVALKEFRHITRDGQTLFTIFSLPIVMMFLFGYALKSEIEDARVVLIDPTPSPESRDLARAIDASRQFALAEVLTGGSPAQTMIRTRARAVILLSPSFAHDLQDNQARIQVLLDGSDPATATTLRNALPAFFRGYLAATMGQKFPEIVQTDTRFLYNPEQKSALFFVPGLMATILSMIGALLTSITVTKEKELGTLANLRISGLHSAEIILGKLLPYFGIAALTGIFILLIGNIAFEVHIKGSVWFLAWTTSLYLTCALGIGLLISTIVAKQQHAMLMSLGITMMPTIMLSGFIFPLASIPEPIRFLSNFVPATWYLQIVRGTILKAAGFAELWHSALALGLMCLVFLGAATARFRKES